MKNFNEEVVVYGKKCSLWTDGEERTEVLNVTAKNQSNKEDIVISGKMGNGVISTSTSGNGSMTFNTVTDSMVKDIQAQFKKMGYYKFDLTTEEGDNSGNTVRKRIDNCKIFDHDLINIDVSKASTESYTFYYNPDDVTVD